MGTGLPVVDGNTMGDGAVPEEDPDRVNAVAIPATQPAVAIKKRRPRPL